MCLEDVDCKGGKPFPLEPLSSAHYPLSMLTLLTNKWILDVLMPTERASGSRIPAAISKA